MVLLRDDCSIEGSLLILSSASHHLCMCVDPLYNVCSPLRMAPISQSDQLPL